MALKDYLEKAGNIGMGALETVNAPFEVIGESIRGAGESEPLKMASAADPSGFRYPSIVQRLAPSIRTQPPADPFMKAYQGLEGIVNLPRGVQAASDVITGSPDLAAQIGGVGLGLGVMPPVARKVASAEMPKTLLNERGAVRIGKGEPYFPPGSPEREANFAKWFGKSQIVDEAGTPKQAFHSSSAEDFERFKRRLGDIGSHFGTTGQAEDRADFMRGKRPSKQIGGERIYPVYLSVENPLRLDDAGSWNWENVRLGVEKAIKSGEIKNITLDEVFQAGRNKGNDNARLASLRDLLESKGYDGIVYRNTGEVEGSQPLRQNIEGLQAKMYEATGWPKSKNSFSVEDQAHPAYKAWSKAQESERDFRETHGQDSYIAFRPEQIKSATGNRGTFDPKDPNITHAVPVAAGVGVAGAAAEAQAEEQPLSEGGIVEEEDFDMPFQSQAQREYMYANHPEIAEEFEEETPEGADLPEYKSMNQGGIVGDWRDEMANHLDQQYGDNQGRTQYMANGGLARDFGLDLDTGLNFQGALNPSSPPPPPAPAFNPRSGLAPVPAPVAPPPPPVESPVALPPDPLPSYLAQQKQAMNRFGPEEQMALERSLDKQRRGLVPNLALGATGFADAIMQGVARAGSSNFQSNLQNRMDKTQEGQRQAFESGRAGNLARVKQDMEFAQIDPESPLSRSIQRANAKTLEGMGYRPEDIAVIPAASMPDVLTKRLTLEEIKSRADLAAEMARNTAAYQAATLAAGERKEKKESEEKAGERQFEAAKEFKAMDKAPKIEIFGSKIPYWFSPVSRQQRREAGNVIRGRISGAPVVSSPSAIPRASQAEAWALAHPNDPKSEEILRRLGK